jgi:predicted amidophosphoribosyltransferase
MGFAAAWAPVAHAGPARALVAGLKFRGALAAADLMAAQIAAGAPDGLLAGAALVPVPSHSSRRRSRGFDPAGQLARALARRTGLPLVRCLHRRGSAAPQLGAPRALRRRPGRVEVTTRGRVPARAALIDDVHTTGATLDACARALRAAGAGEVVALTYARALRGAAG